jgi:acylphosphatase
MSTDAALHLRIYGRVQGVGYRQSLASEARSLGLRGWVRNRSDGSVEAIIQGPSAAVQAALAWARRGPPSARVDRVEQSLPGPEREKNAEGFETLPTL